MLKDPVISEEVNQEFVDFCKKLLDHVLAAAESENTMERKFVARLVDYISNSGNSSVVNTKIVKYLLTAFTKAIDMAGQGSGSEKEKKKMQKTALVSTFPITQI